MVFFDADTLVTFTSSNFIVSESDGSFVVTVVSSGKLQSQSFTVYVIVEANNSTFAATSNVIEVLMHMYKISMLYL